MYQPASVYAEFAALGGRKGWLAFNRLWRLRGVADRLIGGVGFRRGRRHPIDLRVGDAVDFWRVEAVEAGRLVRLRAEMKVPGRAWLQFQAETLGVDADPADPDGVFRTQGAVRSPLLVSPLARAWIHFLAAHSQTRRRGHHQGWEHHAVSS